MRLSFRECTSEPKLQPLFLKKNPKVEPQITARNEIRQTFKIHRINYQSACTIRKKIWIEFSACIVYIWWVFSAE